MVRLAVLETIETTSPRNPNSSIKVSLWVTTGWRVVGEGRGDQKSLGAGLASGTQIMCCLVRLTLWQIRG